MSYNILNRLIILAHVIYVQKTLKAELYNYIALRGTSIRGGVVLPGTMVGCCPIMVEKKHCIMKKNKYYLVVFKCL